MNEADSRSEHLDGLKDEVNPWIPLTEETVELLDPVSGVSETLDEEIEQLNKGLRLQTADTTDELASHGKVVKTPPQTDVSDQVYRKRLLVEYAQLTSRGTPQDVLKLASTLLEVDIEQLSLRNVDAEPVYRIESPIQAIEETVQSNSNAIELLRDISASTYGVEIVGIGSLEYITPEEYQNGNYDSSKGYATLDADGNVTSGGTYGKVYTEN